MLKLFPFLLQYEIYIFVNNKELIYLAKEISIAFSIDITSVILLILLLIL